MYNSNNPNLNYYFNKNVSELVLPEPYPIAEGMKERHRLYSMLLMAITRFYWNGNKEGREGTYPLNPNKYGKFEFSDYIGHNIASLAIDAYGNVIDFEFNHNKLFNSSVEHAESRMIKRIFSLTQINDSWKVSLEPYKPKDDYNTFEDVTIYTTLESCSQCSGVMALARVKEIVYLQTDPGMYLIGNLLRNLTRAIPGVTNSSGSLVAPMPINGKDIDFTYFDNLNETYQKFVSQSNNTAFFIPSDINLKPKFTTSVTSFLCTKNAYDIYRAAQDEFESLTEDKLQWPDYKPEKNGQVIEQAKMNRFVLSEIKDFYQYATSAGKRATPHK